MIPHWEVKQTLTSQQPKTGRSANFDTFSDMVRERVRSVSLLALLVIAVSCGGGSIQPDWEGYAAYLNAEVRDDPITAEELSELSFAPECDGNDHLSVVLFPNNWKIVAQQFFMCGEEYALETISLYETARPGMSSPLPPFPDVMRDFLITLRKYQTEVLD